MRCIERGNADESAGRDWREPQGLLLRVFPAMEYLEYRRMFYAAGLSAISLWAMITARGWLAYDLTGNPSGTGIVTFAAIGRGYSRRSGARWRTGSTGRGS